MAEAFTDNQIQEFYETFCLIDRDSDGFITMEELMKAMGKNPSTEEIEEMINDADFYGSGGVSFEDFLQIIAQNAKESPADELREVFRVFDKDQDGFISAVELGEAMKDMGVKITAEEAEEMVREADLDGDGLLCFYEFSKMMISASF